MRTDFEKLGAFYLGREHDPTRGTRDELLLYDAKDLTTHAVCVGMTGSGKTGLCVTLLEEAAIDGIPSLVVDLKGDLTNLLLTFPELRPADFRPWVDPGEAARKGATRDEHARATAALWRKGLAEWGQDGERIRRLREAAEFAIYTPGSDAARPLTVLKSFNAPPRAVLEDADAFRERVGSAVSGLLALLGIPADPVRSREHILLSTILQHAWRAGKNLDIGTLIQQIQAPPIDRIGVMDLETVYPAGDRFALAMSLNNLLGSPDFAAWMQGDPLDIQRLLWTPTGKPRVAILSIAHLSEAERMFFMTILLNEVVTWMRSQPGTSSLRALLYIDEVFGYLPPIANPPSKRPLLTLLKQARAYGLGVILATQNPVDLDYKALSNAGTWFLGRLQTERDKQRVLDGLEGASATAGVVFNRAETEAILSGLKSRVFLMNNVHENEPVLFHTRWAMSYLRGPLTRAQIRTLHESTPVTSSVGPPQRSIRTAMPSASAPARAAAAAVTGAAPAQTTPAQRPVLPAGVPEFFFPGAAARYQPMLAGTAELHYANARLKVDEWQRVACVVPLQGDAAGDVWSGAQDVPPEEIDLQKQPAPGAAFADLPARAARPKSYTTWERRFKTHVYRSFPLTLRRCKTYKLVSKPDEIEGDFVVRVREAAREKRDLEVEKLRKRFAPKLRRLKDRIDRAQDKVRREKEQLSEKKRSTWLSVGATILGAVFGRKAASVGTVGRASTTMRRAGKIGKEKGDVAFAKQQLVEFGEELQQLERSFQDDVETKKNMFDPTDAEIEEVTVNPRKGDISIGRVVLAWAPEQ